MKKIFLLLAVICLFIVWGSAETSALEKNAFKNDIKQIEESLDEDTADALRVMDINGIDSLLSEGVDQSKIWEYLLKVLTVSVHEPFSVLIVLTAILLLASIAESYTYSLRYVETKEVMSVAVSLFFASVLIKPVTELSSSVVDVIMGASSVMTVYLPVAAGIMLFSGHMITSGGYYTAVVATASFISRFASSVLAPLLNIILSLTVSAGICARVRLNAMIDMLGKFFKYGITFAMSVFIAVIGMNGVLFSAADNVANKAAKFTLSSFVPLVGASVSEAYGAIRNSVNLLRSGIGVFVILAICAAFLPLILRTLLWTSMLGIGQAVGEMLSVSAGMTVLQALMQFLSSVRALLIAVMTLFVISSAVMLTLGGSS